MKTLLKFALVSLLGFGINTVSAEDNQKIHFVPFADFMKLPMPGAMTELPEHPKMPAYEPFVWNRMVTNSAIRPFDMRKIEAQEIEEFAWSMPIIQMVGMGNPLSGERLAKTHRCAKCHGETGISEENDTPSIAGQARPYAFKQMVEYKHKIREERTMSKKMRELSYQDIADLAAFYEMQRPEASNAKDLSKAPKLVTEGDKQRLLIACSNCHGHWGEGIGFEAPAIAGQKAEHFIDTMTEFKEGDRANDLYGRMRFISQQLTDEEIEELAAYYGSLASLEDE